VLTEDKVQGTETDLALLAFKSLAQEPDPASGDVTGLASLSTLGAVLGGGEQPGTSEGATKLKHFLPTELVYDSKNSLNGLSLKRIDFFQFFVAPLPARRSNSQGVKISAGLPRCTQRLEPLDKSFTHKVAFNQPQTTFIVPGELDDILQLRLICFYFLLLSLQSFDMRR